MEQRHLLPNNGAAVGLPADTSRVPLALARQRLLTATFEYYELKDEKHGPAGGFAYERKQNKKGEEVGGIVPHITLKSIANNEPPGEEVLVDRPEIVRSIVRVTGPFTFEATMPTAAGSRTKKPSTPAVQARNRRNMSNGCWRCCAARRCCACPATRP